MHVRTFRILWQVGILLRERRGPIIHRVKEAESSQPPGRVEIVTARRALVLAPHFDDEVIGCGGLLAQLVQGGSQVRVAFLTDGSGGSEGPPKGRSPAEYAEVRKKEALLAGSRLGLEPPVLFGFPDGALSSHQQELEQRLQEVLCSFRPDLLLVPSPLEVTSDHRSAFAALYALLSPLRGGTPLDGIAAELAILAYEVNHPLYPDLLIDVSGQLGDLRDAMACYDSQQARHDYLAAALGLRRYRTHSLSTAVAAAEGYRRLSLEDFTTRSAAALIASLGGAARGFQLEESPTVSIVVRTKNRPELLADALDSLAATRYPKLEVVLVNDGGSTPSVPSDCGLEVTRVEHAQSRGRAAAANAGVAKAKGSWIGFLDDDDLVFPEHLATLAGAANAAGARVVYSDAAVGVYRVSGGGPPAGGGGGWVNVERRLPYSRDFDAEILLLDNYIPFNTLLIDRQLALEVGEFDERFEMFEDWDFLIRLAQHAPFHHLARVTCEYRHFAGSDHHILGGGEDRGRFAEAKAQVLEKHWSLLSAGKISAAVSRLRREVVNLGEGGAAMRSSHREELRSQLELVARLRRDVERLSADLESQSLERERLAQRSFGLEDSQRDLQDRFHQLHGEVVSLRAENARIGADAARTSAEQNAEIARLYQCEETLTVRLAELQAGFEDRGENLERTFAEIERLNQLIGEMEATRAWRWRQRWNRVFGGG